MKKETTSDNPIFWEKVLIVLIFVLALIGALTIITLATHKIKEYKVEKNREEEYIESSFNEIREEINSLSVELDNVSDNSQDRDEDIHEYLNIKYVRSEDDCFDYGMREICYRGKFKLAEKEEIEI